MSPWTASIQVCTSCHRSWPPATSAALISPGSPHRRYWGTSPRVSLPPSQSRNTTLICKAPHGLRVRMFRLPDKRVEGPTPQMNILPQPQLKHLKARLRQRTQVLLLVLVWSCCREPCREGRLWHCGPASGLQPEQRKASSSLPARRWGGRAAALPDAQGAWGPREDAA